MSMHLLFCAKKTMVEICMPLMTSINSLCGLAGQALFPVPTMSHEKASMAIRQTEGKGTQFGKSR